MSNDGININLYANTGDFQIIPIWGREARHAYLDKAEETRFQQAFIYKETDDYMPNIHIYADKRGIQRVKIQVCPSKLLYGTNIYETKEEDLDRFLSLLVERLEYAGILTDESVLRGHYLSGWDVNKPILFPLSSPVLQFLCKQNLPTPKRAQKGLSIYENSEGWGVHFNYQHKCIKLYDKTAEAIKNDIMPPDIKALFQETGSCMVNLEYSMNNKKAVDFELNRISNKLPNTLETAFKKEVCWKILRNRTFGLLDNFYTIQQDLGKIAVCAEQFCNTHKAFNGAQKRNALFGALVKMSFWGYDEYKNHLKRFYSKKQINQHFNMLKEIQIPKLPEEKVFREIISNALFSHDYMDRNSILDTLERYKNDNFIPPKIPVIQTNACAEEYTYAN